MNFNHIENVVLAHKNCDDGSAAAYAAYSALGSTCSVVFCDYSRDDEGQLPWQAQVEAIGGFGGRKVYILDYSVDLDMLAQIASEARQVVWLDHHYSSFQAVGIESPAANEVYQQGHANIRILLDNSKSGCILAWEHFWAGRQIPELFSYIDDNDRWAHKLANTAEAIRGFRARRGLDFRHLGDLLEEPIEQLIQEGKILTRMAEKAVTELCALAMPCTLAGITGLATNGSYEHSSECGNELAKKAGTFGMVWYLMATGKVRVSLRAASQEGSANVAQLARRFGGGGHKCAAGFELDNLQTLAAVLRPNRAAEPQVMAGKQPAVA